MFRKWNLVLTLIKEKWFWLAVGIYLTLGFYVLYVTYSTPFVSIKIQEENGQWIIKEPYYKEWATDQKIYVGDIVINVDGVKVDEVSNITYDSKIRAANTLEILKQNGEILYVQINHLDIPQQFYYLFFSCMFLFPYVIDYFLFKNNPKRNITFKFTNVFYVSYFNSLCK